MRLNGDCSPEKRCRPIAGPKDNSLFTQNCYADNIIWNKFDLITKKKPNTIIFASGLGLVWIPSLLSL